MNTQVPWKQSARPTRPREQNWSQMLRDWLLSTKIAKHEPLLPPAPPRWDLSSFYLSPLPTVPCALSSTWCISVNAGAFEMCRSHWRMCAYIILPTRLAQKSRFSLFENSIMTRLFVTFEEKNKIQESKRTREVYGVLHIFWVTVSLTQMYPLHMKGALLLFINLLDGGLWRRSGSPGDFLRKCLTSPRWLTPDFQAP